MGVMFRNVLRRRGFWKVRGGDEEVFMKHDERIGGIYVTLQNRVAIVRLEDRNVVEVFRSAKHLELYLKKLEEEKFSRLLLN
ncbi:MAG: hypothetical protein QXX87_04860 [Candidatus Jordarchaeales archaeon]